MSSLRQLPANEKRAALCAVSIALGPYGRTAGLIDALCTYAHLDQQHVSDVLSVADQPAECIAGLVCNVNAASHDVVLYEFLLFAMKDRRYSARARLAAQRWVAACDLSWSSLVEKEAKFGRHLDDVAANPAFSQRKSTLRRVATIGAFGLLGGIAVGVTGGLAAPAVLAAFGAASTVSTSVGIGLAAAGAGSLVSGSSIATKIRGVREFQFETLDDIEEFEPLECIEETDQAIQEERKEVDVDDGAVQFLEDDYGHVSVCCGGFLQNDRSFQSQFGVVGLPAGDVRVLRWETKILRQFGRGLQVFIQQQAAASIGSTVLAASSVALAAASLPITMMTSMALVSNPFSLALDRADKAGLLLAESLLRKSRPSTLIGVSVGARVCFRAVQALAAQGFNDIVYSVYLFGMPLYASDDDWTCIRAAVAHRAVHVYSSKDWILGLMAKGAELSIHSYSGTSEAPAFIENIDASDCITSHSAWVEELPALAKRCELHLE